MQGCVDFQDCHMQQRGRGSNGFYDRDGRGLEGMLMERAVAHLAAMTGPLAAGMVGARRDTLPPGAKAAAVSTIVVAMGDTGHVLMARVTPVAVSTMTETGEATRGEIPVGLPVILTGGAGGGTAMAASGMVTAAPEEVAVRLPEVTGAKGSAAMDTVVARRPSEVYGSQIDGGHGYGGFGGGSSLTVKGNGS